ncbi:ArsR/SmtB family transcription factor [Micromonospora polyrhachis]|uniref:DNA-binding transcriptional ArsR family regulator n=1 Tax=Micromonospora polyrhachis TaxID=1282883 RepID=A0A7W7SPV0_9ACTN|nr:helix-turn-helix domain-containing protein [Micromonospora polyrhachis]MBB4958739.1 DNA-binding transcriptional ArsR family regulator [Micromonospora polyrhachis]
MSLGDGPVERDPTVELRALAHPVRLRILSLLTATEMTAAEVARELDLTHANASYHLRHLLDAGVIQVAGEERIRGGVAKRYRYDATHDFDRRRPTPGDAEPTRDHRLLYAALATELRRRGEQARRSSDNFLTDAEFWIDPETWQTVRDQIATAAETLHQASQPLRTPGTIRVSATVALFQMTED